MLEEFVNSANTPLNSKLSEDLKNIKQNEDNQGYINEIVEVLAKDMGEELAKNTVENYKDNIEELKEIYEKTADLWTPIIVEFAKWCDKQSKEHNLPLKFAMRDAEPFAIAYNMLKNNGVLNEEEMQNSLIWINRKVCSIKTEDLKFKEKNYFSNKFLLDEYIKQEGLNKQFFFVDAGCWGTIIKHLHSNEKIDFKGIPLFFFSHNKNIPSFLQSIGISEEKGEIFNDSIESFFPKQYKSVEKFVKNENIVKPELFKETIMQSFYEAFRNKLISNISQYILNKKEFNIDDLNIALNKAQDKEQKEFIGILPTSTPGTVDKDKFHEDWEKAFKQSTASIDDWKKFLDTKQVKSIGL